MTRAAAATAASDARPPQSAAKAQREQTPAEAHRPQAAPQAKQSQSRSGAAHAAATKLDKSMLMDALSRQGMGELLNRLDKTAPPADPVEAAEMRIARERLQYQDASLDRPARVKALHGALDTLRKLIQAHPDNLHRPIWQTDLARMLLDQNLRVIHQNAGAFYEFGVPTDEQRRAFEQDAVEALRAAASARRRFDALRREIGRDKKLAARLRASGLFRRMFDDYADLRTPFYFAQAAHDVILLPDDAPCFQESNKRLPGGRSEPEQEKARLAGLVLQVLGPFTQKASAGAAAGGGAEAHRAAVTIAGGVGLAKHQPEAAISNFREVLQADRDDLYKLIGLLGTARALQLQGRYARAMGKLTAAAKQPIARSNVLYQLLVTDAKHRLLLARARQASAKDRRQEIALAYQPYLDLLRDPSLGQRTGALRQFIVARWAADLPLDVDPAALPLRVRLMVGHRDRVQGQNAVIRAGRGALGPVPSSADKQLQRAIRLTRSVLGAQASPDTRARAWLDLGLAEYYSNPSDARTVLEAASTLMTLARRMPARPRARQAVAYAVSLLRALRERHPRPDGAAGAYRRAARVLFDKFSQTVAAEDERLYYGYNVLEPAGEYKKAAHVLWAVPPGHADYFAAQREALFAFEKVMRRASGKRKAAAREKLRRHAHAIQRQAREALAGPQAGSSSDADGSAGPRTALAGARLVLAQAAMSVGKTDEALKLLDGFEQDFAGRGDLIRMALQRRIIALARAGRLDRLTDEAEKMMHAFPDEAASVIDRVLARLNQRISKLQRQGKSPLPSDADQTNRRAARLGSTASMLSKLLLEWAGRRGISGENLLPYQLIHVRSLRLAGRAKQAAADTRALVRRFPDRPKVIHQHAESLFALGGRAALTRAARWYDKLIAGLRPPYPDLWWNAWMRRLQINDRLGEQVSDIPLRVRQLKLTDPNLGGPPYKRTLEALANKYEQTR